jgi:hypothetical protein
MGNSWFYSRLALLKKKVYSNLESTTKSNPDYSKYIVRNGQSIYFPLLLWFAVNLFIAIQYFQDTKTSKEVFVLLTKLAKYVNEALNTNVFNAYYILVITLILLLFYLIIMFYMLPLLRGYNFNPFQKILLLSIGLLYAVILVVHQFYLRLGLILAAIIFLSLLQWLIKKFPNSKSTTYYLSLVEDNYKIAYHWNSDFYKIWVLIVTARLVLLAAFIFWMKYPEAAMSMHASLIGDVVTTFWIYPVLLLSTFWLHSCVTIYIILYKNFAVKNVAEG